MLLVHDFRVAIVVLQVLEDIIWVFTTEVAKTSLDPHHFPNKAGPIGTYKLHIDGLGLVRDAAALVCAHAAVLWPVLLLTGAPRYSEIQGLFVTVDVQTLFPWLDVFGDVHLAGAQVAQTGLFDELTLVVVIGNPQGHAAATRLGAGAPGGSLGDAVLVPAVGLRGQS